ncbi:MAG: DUF4440 domain-containing protein [Pirellulaceae bacterium]|jgi:uncharacterized protein (TIGR02246 family)|nr:DUF4440 domain-containing protein [Pirellulaceae bacterium]
MKHIVHLVVLLVALVGAWTACVRILPPTAHAGPQTQTDEQEIRAWLDRYCATVTAGDFAGYRHFWTDDVVWLPPHAPVRRGIEACMEHNRPYFEYYESVEKMVAEEIKIRDAFAYALVSYTYEGTPKPGQDVEPLQEDGKGIFLFQRRPDGTWVATHCVWNSNLPL